MASALGALLSGAIAATAAAANKKNSTTTGSSSTTTSTGSTSGSSSGSSSGGSNSTTSSSYKATGTNTDANIQQSNASDYAAIQQAKSDYATAQARGDQAGMATANNTANAIRAQYGYSGGSDGSGYYATTTGASGNTGSGLYGTAQNTITDGLDSYTAYMEAAQRAQQKAQEAAVQQSVKNLTAQKSEVTQAGTDANTAAEQAYMGLINPNSATAEALAARGLSASGLSESSMISAGNTYQNALNANQRSVNEQLAQIDLAIENAQLTGDIATAETLASYKQAIAAQAAQSYNQLAALQQQGVSDAFNNAYTLAGLTGSINGQQTLDGRTTASQIAAQTVETQIQQENLKILLALGYSQAEAELQAQKLSNAGISLNNQLTQSQITGQNLQNQYMSSQM